MLGPKRDAWPHDLVFRLEGRHQSPIERKRPEHGAEERGQADDEAGEIEMTQAGKPARGDLRREIGGGFDRRGHRTPRARKSWNCNTDRITIKRNSTTAAASARPPLFI